jgi:hypothetical protein
VSAVSNCIARGSEELHFEAALHAVFIYKRARLIRRLAIVVVVTIAATRLILHALHLQIGENDLAIPVLVGISLLASLLSISLEWSTRTRCRECLDDFYTYCRRRKHV